MNKRKAEKEQNVRTYGSGTYSGGVWRLKEKKKDGNVIRPNISKSPAQLCEIFRVNVPTTKEGTRTLWTRYLSEWRNLEQKKRQAESPLQERIRSLESFISETSEHGADTSILEKELTEAANVPSWNIDHQDAPALHPAMREIAANASFGKEPDDFMVRLLNSLAPSPIPKNESLASEIERYLVKRLESGDKQHSIAKTSLQFLKDACGEIRIKDINKEHWRTFIEKVKARAQEKNWSERHSFNINKEVKRFLARMEIDHDLTFRFLKNPDYRFKKGEGKKEQWSIEQVRLALSLAKGNIRAILLNGLNFGQYKGDIFTNTKVMVKTGTTQPLPETWSEEVKNDFMQTARLHRGRDKNEHQGNAPIGAWKIWSETDKVLSFAVKEKDWQAWETFCEANAFPSHKALRKTVAQWIQDSFGGETAARLYRCEKGSGTHHASYIKAFTPEQVAQLDKALKAVETFLFGQDASKAKW